MFDFLFGKKNKKKNAGSRSIENEQKYLLTHKSDFFLREAYKTMRTNVTFALASEKPCSTIIVTSSMQSEGKSITATNLAISYAQQGKKVIIIDCDMRRPKLGRLIGVSSPVGLSNTLLKPELISQAILHVEKLGIDAILAGDIPPNPSELLGSGKMSRLLDALKERYNYIILDTPPINMVTDAMVLSPKSDGVLFVVRANQSERGAVAHAVEQMEYAKARILGFVLNGVDMENTAYGYSKYKRYRRYGKYGYGYSKYGYGYGGYGYGGYGYGYEPPMMPPHEEKDKE